MLQEWGKNRFGQSQQNGTNTGDGRHQRARARGGAAPTAAAAVKPAGAAARQTAAGVSKKKRPQLQQLQQQQQQHRQQRQLPPSGQWYEHAYVWRGTGTANSSCTSICAMLRVAAAIEKKSSMFW